MDKLTKEVLDFKYPDAFIASLENPLANADPLPGFQGFRMQIDFWGVDDVEQDLYFVQHVR